ncbi:SusC/RagA family TonB-linked outer membrane protein [Riemerella anatipestifer]|uniref:SusC/RagA family TonB-linked outer membrane protein n=1 Tax=Riemerella anatipestifer TaxID=34085 RepID=UPI001C6F2AB0|nr:SusC/RagA family TonB-linked outer membrane protein [Riemerella anatipestifer]MCW0522557.1 SusC/RagA family TonB-linked outer membrane protein [Riemerella anatipestifer]QYR01497.1 SusC/RagA family TonB-linked outer membrane protein [Riemerella anatipestifer]
MKRKLLNAGALGLFLVLGNNIQAQVKVKDSTKTRAIEEVVIVAYGKQKAKAIVGSVSSVGKDVLSTQQTSNIATAIQGSVPGVNIIGSSTPGATPTIRVRGIGSINASSDPLIIVDGAQYSGSLSNISQEEIESINVLKDGSATSLYGSRGANGVILVTTKKGRKGAPRVTVQSSLGYAAPVNQLYPLIDNNRYLNYTWEALRNSKVANGVSADLAGAQASAEVIPLLKYNPYNVKTPIDANGQLVPGAQLLWNTNWADYLLNRSAERSETSATVSGGTDQSNYFLSVNYLKQEGAVKTTNFERFSTRLNLETKIKPWLTAGLNTAYISHKRNIPAQSGTAYGSPINSIYTLSSVYPVHKRDSDGNLVYDDKGNLSYDYGAGSPSVLNSQRPFSRNVNPLGYLYDNTYLYRVNTLTLNGFVKIDFSKDLSFRSNYSLEQNNYNNHNYRNNRFGSYAAQGGAVIDRRDIASTKNFVNSLNYNKQLGNHNLTADAIVETFDRTYDYMSAMGVGLFSGIETLSGATSPSSVSGYPLQQRLVGLLGRASYNYKEKYFVEGSFRRDGSSVFSKETRWGNFFSVGGAYIVSEENFLKGNKTISFLKLKSSYGELGNNDFTDADGVKNYFPYLSTYLSGYSVGSNIGVILSSPKDAFLTWEKTASFNAGIELGLFQNRVNLNVDYYDKRSVDLVGPLVTAGSTGATSITTNIGKLRNYGWEFSINTKNVRTANFRWDTGLNFSFDRNKILALSADNKPQTVAALKRWEVGRSLYDFYIQEYAGVNPDNGNPLWYKDVTDANGKVTKVTTESYSEATRYYNRSSLPFVIGGLNNYLKYKNFDLNALVNFSFGSYIYDGDYARLMSGKFDGYSKSVDLERRWQKPGDVTDVPRLSYTTLQENQQSSRFLFKNDYVRLKALNIGYNFNKEDSEKIGLKSLRLFLQADNLFTWQTRKNIDPEQALTGLTNNRTSNLKTISFGLKLEL